MRPRLVCECDGVAMFWIEDLRTHDSDSITAVLSLDGKSRYFPWPVGDDGQPVNPWRVTMLDFLHGVKLTDQKPPAERPETWRTKPPML